MLLFQPPADVLVGGAAPVGPDDDVESHGQDGACLSPGPVDDAVVGLHAAHHGLAIAPVGLRRAIVDEGTDLSLPQHIHTRPTDADPAELLPWRSGDDRVYVSGLRRTDILVPHGMRSLLNLTCKMPFR